LGRRKEANLMLDFRVYFDKDRLFDLLSVLFELPAPVRPQYFGESEKQGSKANRVDNSELFSKFVRNHPGGFFLFADDSLFQFFTAGKTPTYFVACCSKMLSAKVLKAVFESVASIDVPFAIAADEGEYRHRNRIFHEIGKNNIESWVGRDIRKYLPGLYWCTMISESLLRVHNVDLSALEASALSSDQIGGCHLLKFFDSSKDWEAHATQLDDLCESMRGIFSSRSLNMAASRATNYMEYSDIVDQWR
jgi:hypothetical protein